MVDAHAKPSVHTHRPGLQGVITGYDRRSAATLGVFVVIGSVSAVVWREHVPLDLASFDPLLAACWVGMAALAIRRVDVVRDGRLAMVALLGGALIEAWGTRSGLWTYFTREAPPLFILPAWPAAALATERVSELVGRLSPPSRGRGVSALRWLCFAGFAALLVRWSAPGLGHPLTWVAFACVLVTMLTSADARSDSVRFAAGALVGYPLERWGTTRGCWTYWSGELPPLVAVLAHGFATVAFARGAALVAGLAARVRAVDAEAGPGMQ